MANNKNRRSVTLHGRVFLQGNIKTITGLHIGGAAGALEIGGVDSPIIRDPLTNRPFIPGSSLRGKMRSLTERLHGSEQNMRIGKGVFVHICRQKKMSDAEYREMYRNCPVCSVFGVTGDEGVPHPTSLVVRDVYLGDDSAAQLDRAQTDFPYSEIKWEATIDRVTSAAVPRQIERVPAGTLFEGFELAYGIYDASGRDHFATVLKALQLVEEDYLGGLGSRGGGKVEFQITNVYARKGTEYKTEKFEVDGAQPVTDHLVTTINDWVKQTFEDVGD
ncbi:MAG: type III-A CRISPR-associated RAMP protein Csm3 [Chloroflexota bacterium]|nr:type III-A CRISPR-associated RAMP protein Csm3 [Chloroflexota bacterium]